MIGSTPGRNLGDRSPVDLSLIHIQMCIRDSAITDLNIEEYAKKNYVDDAVSNIDFDQYVTKENADSTYLNTADYIKFDPTNYCLLFTSVSNIRISTSFSLARLIIQRCSLWSRKQRGRQEEKAQGLIAQADTNCQPDVYKRQADIEKFLNSKEVSTLDNFFDLGDLAILLVRCV